MSGDVLGNVLLQYGWPGFLMIFAVSVLFIWLKFSMNKSNKNTSETLTKGFTDLSTEMSKNNTKLVKALVDQNKTNTEALINIVNTALMRRETTNKITYDRNLKLREMASYKIKQKIF